VVNPTRVKRAGTADDTIHFVPLAEQKLGKIRAILSGDAGD